MMSSLEDSANNFDPRLVIGPTQVCGLLSAVLFGCLACQSYVYFARFPSDHLALKATVSAVILLQLGHFVCIISTLWTMTVSSYGDSSQLRAFPLAADLAIPLSGFTVSIVQTFYIFRLWKFTRNLLLPILCGMLIVGAQILTLILAVRATSAMDLVTFGDLQFLLIGLLFIARAACDMITTTGTAWSLRKQRCPDSKETATMIDRLICWTIETGLITSLMATALATWFLVVKQTYVWFAVWLMWPNVVGNSLLTSLNRRLLLRESWKAPRGDAQSRGGEESEPDNVQSQSYAVASRPTREPPESRR
ncbi:hypothetical protein EDB19DRAFT_967910 [Suillus lakei]|nr:hypothetical protein EDB19DRAFT_967910 [Suillus lakei]